MRAAGKKRMRGRLPGSIPPTPCVASRAFENRIERLEAEAELAGTVSNRRPAEGDSLDARFDRLAADEDVERELASLKARRTA